MTSEITSQVEYLQLLEAYEAKLKYNKLETIFPLEGKYCLDKYQKQKRFFSAGAIHSQRLLAGGNRVGKSMAGAYEMACHLTGIYPKWWEGRRFLNPVKAWACGISWTQVQEVMQEILLGPLEDLGSGMIPKDKILGSPKMKAGTAGSVLKFRVQHVSGGVSELMFKTYEQGREEYQGTKKDIIWLDEEPRDPGIYEECLMRLMDDTTPGILMITFTPLLGITKMVSGFLKNRRFTDSGTHPEDPAKFALQVTWDDVPHLSESQKQELLRSIAPHLRDARTKGIPHLGAGAIYPYPEEDIKIEPFAIPSYWPKAYSLDVGWKRTAALWAAMDPDSGIYYLYSEHYQGAGVPAVHASAIKARGEWMFGAIDPGSRVTNQKDGTCLFDTYIAEGLNLELAVNAVEAGITNVRQLIESGRLKVFGTLLNWFVEFGTYMRDENGKVKDKQDDHLMDCTRYLIMTFNDIYSLPPFEMEERDNKRHSKDSRDTTTGY